MIKYKLSSEFVIFENYKIPKKKSGNSYCNAWYYIQWSHKSVCGSVWTQFGTKNGLYGIWTQITNITYE